MGRAVSKPVTTMSPEEAQDAARKEVACVLRAKGGDADAFGELVRAYQRRAVAVSYRLLGNTDDATDVCQDAFVRAYRNLGQLDDPARFGAWLMRVVTNLSLNFRRVRKNRATGSLDDVEAASAEVRSSISGQRMQVGLEDEGGPLASELHVAVTKAMEQLPEKQRLALILFSVEGMPQKDVADILECSIELVKWNVFQARKKMKELLAEHL